MAMRKEEPAEEAPEVLDEELAKQVADAAEGKTDEEPPAGPDPDVVEINLDDDEPKDDDDDEPRPTRKDKKRERGKLLQAKEQTEKENQELRERLARLEGRVQSMPTHQPQGGQKDPLEQAWDKHKKEAREFHQWWSAQTDPTPEQQQAAEDRAWELRRREVALGAAEAQRRAAPSPEAARKQALAQQVQIRYPDVFQSPKRDQVLRLAAAMEDQETAMGKTASWELLDDCIKRAKTQLGLGSPPPPSDAQKRRYTSQPRRAGTSGSGPRTVTLSKTEKQMAREMFRPAIQDGSMTETQALKQFYKEVLEPQQKG